jgi:hypothetical protein
MVAGLLLWGGSIAGITACSTTTLGPAAQSGVTPAGSYWVTITAKETGSIPVTSNGSVPVTPIVLFPANGNDVSLPFTVNVTVK